MFVNTTERFSDEEAKGVIAGLPVEFIGLDRIHARYDEALDVYCSVQRSVRRRSPDERRIMCNRAAETVGCIFAKTTRLVMNDYGVFVVELALANGNVHRVEFMPYQG